MKFKTARLDFSGSQRKEPGRKAVSDDVNLVRINVTLNGTKHEFQVHPASAFIRLRALRRKLPADQRKKAKFRLYCPGLPVEWQKLDGDSFRIYDNSELKAV